VPVLTRVGKFIGDSLITSAEGASPSGPLLRDPTAPNLPGDETLGIISDKPERRLGRRIVNPSPASASQATVPAVPFVPSNEGFSPDDRASFSDRFGNWTSSPDDIARRNPSLPVPPPDPGRPLGIFSGKPMPLWTTPPPLGGLLNNSNAAGNNDWFNFLAGLALQNPTPPAPPLQTGGKPERSLGRRIVNPSQASAVDARASAAPLAPSDDSNFSGGLLGRFVALAGVDPQNPNQPAPPPLDDEQEQADMRALDARLSRSGNIRDAVALYNARKSSRR
jgi:hypothetical protein